MPYREEIYHPALPEPDEARGWFDKSDGDDLVLHQTEPSVETLTIGEDYIWLQREADSTAEILPIPSEMQPLLDMLRMIVAGTPDLAKLSDAGFRSEIRNNEAGWRLTLTSNSPDDAARRMVMYGCGDVLRAVELQLPDGGRRRYVFEETR